MAPPRKIFLLCNGLFSLHLLRYGHINVYCKVRTKSDQLKIQPLLTRTNSGLSFDVMLLSKVRSPLKFANTGGWIQRSNSWNITLYGLETSPCLDHLLLPLSAATSLNTRLIVLHTNLKPLPNSQIIVEFANSDVLDFSCSYECYTYWSTSDQTYLECSSMKRWISTQSTHTA